MSLKQRLVRLEHAEEERSVLEMAEEIAKECGSSLEDVLHDYQELSWRVARGGADAAVRWIAEECGVSEDEVRTHWPAAREESGEA